MKERKENNVSVFWFGVSLVIASSEAPNPVRGIIILSVNCQRALAIRKVNKWMGHFHGQMMAQWSAACV